MIEKFLDVIKCNHVFKEMRDVLGGVSASVCYKCGWTEKSVEQLEDAMVDLKESLNLLELFEKVKDKE